MRRTPRILLATLALGTLVSLSIRGDVPKTDPTGKLAFSPETVKQLLHDARAHGDAARGAVVFGMPTSACLSCHKVSDRGGSVGPELTKVGFCLPPEEIVEAVYWPNRTVKPEFKAVSVTTLAGKTVCGVVRREDEKEVILVDPSGKVETIAKEDIEARTEIGSLMPEGLLAALTKEQRQDLLRYLLELGKTEGLEKLSHEPARFAYSREPLHPEDWPNRDRHVNRDRLYDFYAREAMHFQKAKPVPMLLPEWPGLDNGKYGHWGNQNDTVWKDNRWNLTDLGTLQGGVFRSGNLVVARAVCVRVGDGGEMALCFNPDTLQVEALWKGGFVRFTDRRHGFMEGLTSSRALLPKPPAIEVKQPFAYRGFYRVGKRVVFSYKLGEVEMLDAPWVQDGEFIREVAPADKHSLAGSLKGGKPQWPQVMTTEGRLGAGKPYAIDTVPLPVENPWKALLFISGHDFLADGTAIVCTMQGDVWRVEGLDESLKSVRWRRVASGLHQPLGLVVDKDQVYVLGRDQITRLIDLNGDGEADFYECFSNAYQTSPAGHDFICGLERDASGNFYTASGNQGLLRISPDGKKADVLATGFRNPDGLGLTPSVTVTVPCSEGEWTPASMICEVRPDAKKKPHFGYGGPVDGQPPALPLVYLPRGLDNSSGGQLTITSDKWGPVKGLMVHTSFGAAAHFLLLRDEVEGQPQGAIVPLAGDFRSGVHRGRFHPRDGQLYLSGMDGWGSYASEDGCFQRVRYTGEPVQLPVGFHAHRNGVMVKFSAPLEREWAEKPENHFAQCWNYRYSSAYGSREFSPTHYGTPGHDAVRISSAKLLPDGRSLFLETPDLQPVNVLHLRVGVGRDEARELFATVHKLGEPYTDLPNYREVVKPVAAHPILRDLAFAAKKVPNPWQKPLPNAREVVVEAGKNLTFVTPLIKAKAGENIRLVFKNPDVVPHNWALIRPGTLPTVGDLTNRMVADPEAVVRHYVPRTKDVLAYTDIVQPKQSATIHFQAPTEKGRYPFLCTFPGHWMVMNGEMVVEE